MIWYQKHIVLAARARGYHIITSEITEALCDELSACQIGQLQVFIQHTSASLTLNENADPTVRKDFESVLNRLVPDEGCYLHQDEGQDDLPAHIKSSLLGASIVIPVAGGTLALGTWQGVYLCEHRNYGPPRHLILTLMGQGV